MDKRMQGGHLGKCHTEVEKAQCAEGILCVYKGCVSLFWLYVTCVRFVLVSVYIANSLRA